MASTIKVDNVQNTPGTNIINKCSTTITIGASSDTIALACGASQTGFGRTGTVDWQTGSIKTSTFTATSGEGYFVNTTAGVITVNLPAGSAGDIVGLKDYAGTWDSYAVTINPDGSDKIGGASAVDPTVANEGGSLLLVYVDGTQGWLTTQESVTTSPSGAENYLVATGGTPCTGAICGDYKTHAFTGPGTFTVCSLSTCAANDVVDYLVVAGAGGSGTSGPGGGGGGAGGFRMSNSLSLPAPTTSPLASPTGIPVAATGYPITVGAGGAAGAPPGGNGADGADTIFSTITSTGGGWGGGFNDSEGNDGGSGGGGGDPDGPQPNAGGAGDTPSTPIAQGFGGGAGTPPSVSGDGNQATGGGGGAAAAGADGTNPPHTGGAAGIGSFIADGFIGPTAPSYGTPGPVSDTRYFSGGGGGTSQGGKGAGGAGGGGTTGPGTTAAGVAGTVNTGGGASGGTCSGAAAAGGSGIVIIRYKFQ